MSDIKALVMSRLGQFGTVDCAAAPDRKRGLLDITLNGHSYFLEKERDSIFALYESTSYPNQSMFTFTSIVLKDLWIDSLTDDDLLR